jgi:alpha-glucosidase
VRPLLARPLLSCTVVAALLGVASAREPAAVASFPDGVELSAPGGHLRASFPAPGTVRLRLWPQGGAPPGGSWAVDPAALAAPLPPEVSREDDAVVVRAGGLSLRVDPGTLAFTVRDQGGAVVAEAEGPVAWARGGAGGKLGLALAPGEEAYGLGDKARGLSRRGQAFDLWNYDAYAFRPDTDPLYKSIPFLVLVGGGRARGIFVDSAARAHVDVGAAAPGRLGWEVERGAFDLYLFAGPSPAAVIGAYTALTGRTPLPPLWALGYHQSRYSYRSEAEVRELVRRFREERFPLDVVWLDIDFQEKLAPFRVNRKAFPHLERMVADLLSQGVRTVVITDPHIRAEKGTEPYDGGLRGDHFILDPSSWPEGGGPPRRGARPFLGKVWPGDSAFPEFTLERTRRWWGGLYRPYVRAGVAGFWDDMNEPALFNVRKSMPEEVRHRLDGGGTADHVAIHNAYGLLQARATFEGVQALRPGARPFVLTRAAYAGAQRWAATWTGDDRADREGMALTVPMLLNLGTSGFALAGADVGGFDGCPDPALLTAWMELGAYQPFFRNHSAKDTCRREPWVNGPDELRRQREAVLARYRLLPFLYTLFEESSRTGLPVMRPLWLEHPDDPGVAREERAFQLGRDLLVAPRLAEGTGPFPVELPAGEWWDVARGVRVGGGRIEASPPSEQTVAVYARAGAIVPQGPAPAHAADRPQGPLTLEVWPGSDCRGELYLDAGEGHGYRAGELRRIHYTCTPAEGGIAVSATSEGPFPTWWSATEVVVHGVPRPPSAEVGGAPADVRYDEARQAATVTVPGGEADLSVTVSW